jgi:hypothetical protein
MQYPKSRQRSPTTYLKNMKTTALLPAQNNFADLRELADKLLKKTGDDNLTRPTAIVGTLLYRCDLLEREVERIGRCMPGNTTKRSVSVKKPRG